MRSKSKRILMGTAIVLAVVILVCIGLEVFGKGRVKPSEWFGHTEESVTGAGVLGDGGEEMSADKVYEMPAKMTFLTSAVSAANTLSGSVTLHATVQPETATFQELVWSAAFADPESYWARDKTVTDYLTVSAVDESTHTALVRCLQPFGEQIIITAASVYNPDVSKTVTVDYMCDITFLGLSCMRLDFYRGTVYLDPETDDLPQDKRLYQYVSNGSCALVNYQDNGKHRGWDSMGINVSFGVGTIVPSMKGSLSFEYSDEFYNLAVPYQDGPDWEYFKREEGEDFSHKNFDLVAPEISPEGEILNNTEEHEGYTFTVIPISGIGACWAYNPSAIIGIGHIDEFLADVLEAHTQNPDLIIGTIKFEFTSAERGKFVGSVDCKFDPETVKAIEDGEVTEVSDIEIAEGENIVFGG